MRFSVSVLLVSVIIVSGGCSSKRPRTEEDLLRLAFEALKERQWEQYSRLIITRADFFLYEDNISEFEEPNSYLGSVIKPEQIEMHKNLFFRSIQGGQNFIRFDQTEFCRPGSLLKLETKKLIEKDPVILNTYSLVITDGNTEFDTKELYPHFTVAYVPWMGQYRILELELPPIAKTDP